MVVRLRVKEVAKEKGISMGRLQREANVAYNTVKRMFKDPYYITTTETLGKLARGKNRCQVLMVLRSGLSLICSEPYVPHTSRKVELNLSEVQ